MDTDRLQTLAAFDPTRLTEIVRRAQARPRFEIGSWEVRHLSSAGMINPEGLFLFSGDTFGVALGEEALRWMNH